MSNILFPVTHTLDKLAQAYNEPHRKYHNFGHIARMFEIAATENIPLSMEEVLAIWFHDFVYVPCQKDNEEKSSNAFLELYKNSHPIERTSIQVASRIILDTKKEEIEHSGNSGTVIDLDLWDLGTDRYWSNKERIKEEFLPYLDSDQAFYSGRTYWIESMLARDSIFVSKYATLEMERAARKNLREDLELLND